MGICQCLADGGTEHAVKFGRYRSIQIFSKVLELFALLEVELFLSINLAKGDSRIMTMRFDAIVSPDEHLLTVQEALEPLYLKLEVEAEAKLLKAALRAGWSADEASQAIDQLRRHDLSAGAETKH